MWMDRWEFLGFTKNGPKSDKVCRRASVNTQHSSSRPHVLPVLPAKKRKLMLQLKQERSTVPARMSVKSCCDMQIIQHVSLDLTTRYCTSGLGGWWCCFLPLQHYFHTIAFLTEMPDSRSHLNKCTDCRAHCWPCTGIWHEALFKLNLPVTIFIFCFPKACGHFYWQPWYFVSLSPGSWASQRNYLGLLLPIWRQAQCAENIKHVQAMI